MSSFPAVRSFSPPRVSRRAALAAGVGGLAALWQPGRAVAHPNHGGVVPDPRNRFKEPIELTRFDVIRLAGPGGTVTAVRATDADGGVGVVPAHGRLPQIRSLFESLAAPYFTGRDARDLPTLIDHVDTAERNYKFVGMPFWNAVAHCELAVWDLLGRRAGLSCTDLLGRRRRRRIAVYVSRFDRDTTPGQAVLQASEDLEATGADAVKLKVGRRMSTTPDQNARDLAMVALARKTWGDDVEILLDANGSYTSDEAVRAATRFADHGVGFLEEPCDWRDVEATLRAREKLDAKGVRIDLAGGEQDSSLPVWRRFAKAKLFRPMQPDLFYVGGAVRLLTVAALADGAKLPVTPHAPRAGLSAYPDTAVRATIANLGRVQEYRHSPDLRDGFVTVPTGPGWGLPWDDAAVRAAKRAA
ncbi:MAG: mandelate racemase/muconate lactonizing enzyme family protein [Planctomycetota bacterium]